MTHTNCRVSDVEGTSFTECGFIIKNADDAPLVWLTYETQAKAEEAHRLIDKAIEGAVISPAWTRRVGWPGCCAAI
jgi:uncharacterized protein YfcZ (UPF0381/DUF406 family)